MKKTIRFSSRSLFKHKQLRFASFLFLFLNQISN